MLEVSQVNETFSLVSSVDTVTTTTEVLPEYSQLNVKARLLEVQLGKISTCTVKNK